MHRVVAAGTAGDRPTGTGVPRGCGGKVTMPGLSPMAKMCSRRSALGGALAAVAARPGLAQAAWPSRPLRLIVPFPPGGATDLLARVLAERLGARLGQAVVVENRGGAAGVIAAELASRAEPDGYALFFASIGTASINP